MIFANLSLALEAVRRNTLRSVLTMLGVVIGVAAVVMMVTLGQSASAKITGEVASLGNNLLIVSPGRRQNGPPSGPMKPFDLADVAAMEAAVGADGLVAPESSSQTAVVYGSANHLTTLRGVTPAYLEVRGYDVAEGRTIYEADVNGGSLVCLIGVTTQTELFGGASALGQSVRLGHAPCTVVGVLAPKGKSTMGQDQDDTILLPLTAMQRRVMGDDHVAMVFVSVSDEGRIPRVQKRVQDALHVRRRVQAGLEDDFTVSDMREVAATLSTVTSVLTAFLGAVGAVSLLVGGIGIMNIMLVSVTERTREIGVRLAIGARPGDIRLQFLVESVVLSVLGGTIGVVVGLLGALGATKALDLTFTPNFAVVGGSFIFCAVVGVAFGWLPAQRASALDPIVALRHE